jgi:hypothetical protein|nr:MAG TPA: hypothetical protein [Ackermannviridae sp.]
MMNALSWIFHLTAEQIAIIGVAVSGTYFSLSKSGVIPKAIALLTSSNPEDKTPEACKVYADEREKLLDENKELKDKLVELSRVQKTLQLRISLLENVIESQKGRIQEITGLLISHEQKIRSSPEAPQKD